MVWGINFPSNFGDFWPKGQFEGKGPDAWTDRLSAYYEAQSPEVQKSLFELNEEETYRLFVSSKFREEIGVPRLRKQPLTPIQPHEPPQSYYTEKTYKTLGSLIALNSGLTAVDEALKAIIERLEPNKHQFFPIDIIMPRGVAYPKNYYVLVIGQYFNSFMPDKSDPTMIKDIVNSGYYSHVESKAGLMGLALSKDVYGHAHLWRERYLRRRPIFFSDTMMAEIDKAGLRIPKHYKMKEV